MDKDDVDQHAKLKRISLVCATRALVCGLLMTIIAAVAEIVITKKWYKEMCDHTYVILKLKSIMASSSETNFS